VPTSSVLALLNPNGSSTNISTSNSISGVTHTQRSIATVNGNQTPTLVNSVSVSSGALLTQRVSSAITSVSHTTTAHGPSVQHVQHFGQNVVSVAQVQAQLQQQQQHSSGSGSAPQLTSPIIIRSNQGDFVIPGHISLGRGMQGRYFI
jgi:predicted phage gp36 major capsid-like protein